MILLSGGGGAIYGEIVYADPPTAGDVLGVSRFQHRRVHDRGAALTTQPGINSIDPLSLIELVDLPAGDPARTLLADNSIPRPERIALAIAGPAFQWR